MVRLWLDLDRRKHKHEHCGMDERLQLQKSFEYVYDFLLFTTEGEDEYPELMLPTLDFQTRVLNDGQIRFQYFSKKMENNRVLDIQTALSKNTIFSALRQNLVRRLLNTGQMVEHDTRMEIIDRFIQLMRIRVTSLHLSAQLCSKV